MPRLTTKDYLRTHDRLRKLWLRNERVFAELSPMDQWLLHDFFKPGQDLPDLPLLMHRDAVTAKQPSMPHKAGKALSRFWELAAQLGLKRVARAKALASASRVRQPDRKLSVKALVRPDIDPHQLARAFIALAAQRPKPKPPDEQKPDGQMRDRP